MSIGVSLIMLAELLLAGFVVWGFMHEDRFIAFEKRLAKRFASRASVKKKAAKRLRIVPKNVFGDPGTTAA